MKSPTRSKPQTPETYIWPKPGARHLWFRLAVPRRYQEAYGRKIVQRSLETSDRREASIRAARMRADLFDTWRALGPREPLSPDDTPVVSLAIEPTTLDLTVVATEAAYLEMRGKLAALTESKRFPDNPAHLAHVAYLRDQMTRLVRTRKGEARRNWERLADKRIARNNWLLPKQSEGYERFIDMIAEAFIEALRVEAEHLAGNSGVEPTSPTVVKGLRAAQERAKPGQAVIDLFDLYGAQRASEGRKRADTVAQDRKVVESFVRFVGEQRSLRSITAADVREWRDAVATAPPNYKKMNRYKGLTLRQAASAAREAGDKGLSLTSINKYLSTLSPFFTWARSNSWVDINPCEGLFYTRPKKPKNRPPFDSDELNRILSSPLFTGFLRDGKEFLPGDQRADDWRYWIPLICLFTGARIGEIAQLRIPDIEQLHGVWVLHIRDEESMGQRTKSGYSRHAAVHSKLQAIGFLGFVDRQKDRAVSDGDQRLFPELEKNERGHVGAKASRFWRTYLCHIGVKEGADGRGAHSFRHTLADQLRTAHHLDNEIAVALGHNQKSVTSGYGKIKQGSIQRISDLIESVEFAGVRFDHLIARTESA